MVICSQLERRENSSFCGRLHPKILPFWRLPFSNVVWKVSGFLHIHFFASSTWTSTEVDSFWGKRLKKRFPKKSYRIYIGYLHPLFVGYTTIMFIHFVFRNLLQPDMTRRTKKIMKRRIFSQRTWKNVKVLITLFLISLRKESKKSGTFGW